MKIARNLTIVFGLLTFASFHISPAYLYADEGAVAKVRQQFDKARDFNRDGKIDDFERRASKKKLSDRPIVQKARKRDVHAADFNRDGKVGDFEKKIAKKKWAENHPKKAHMKKWAENHPDAAKHMKKKFTKDHPKAAAKKWAENHPDAAKHVKKAWAKKHHTGEQQGHAVRPAAAKAAYMKHQGKGPGHVKAHHKAAGHLKNQGKGIGHKKHHAAQATVHKSKAQKRFGGHPTGYQKSSGKARSHVKSGGHARQGGGAKRAGGQGGRR
jgi:hypothetical protein